MYMPYLTTYSCRIDILTWMQLTGRGSPAVPHITGGDLFTAPFLFFYSHYYNRKGIHALPMPTFGIFSLYSVGVGAPGEAME
jgi:hypothetical protein